MQNLINEEALHCSTSKLLKHYAAIQTKIYPAPIYREDCAYEVYKCVGNCRKPTNLSKVVLVILKTKQGCYPFLNSGFAYIYV